MNLDIGNMDDQILIDNGEMFDGSRGAFTDCFFSNATDEEITIWCKGNKWSLQINDNVILKYTKIPSIKEYIAICRDTGDFTLFEDCPEDKTPDRTEYDELMTIAENLFEIIKRIENEDLNG